jgi:CP family cyanate transporter-like MFS transporter
MSGPSTAVRLTTLLFISLNLRPVISSLPPIGTQIQESTGWNDPQLGLLTSVPVLVMAFGAPIVPLMALRLGRATTVSTGMALIAVATFTRFFASGHPVLLVVSALVGGAGIAVTAGVMPGFVRDWFPSKVTSTTGETTGAMIIGAAAAALLAVPMSQWLGGWQLAAGAWCLPALAALVLWMQVARRSPVAAIPVNSRISLPIRNVNAWMIAGFLAVNSFVFYALVAWLAISFDERGWTPAEGGALLGFGTSMQIVGALLLPRLVERLNRGRTAAVIAVISVTAAALFALAIAPHLGTWLLVALVGIGLGAAFALALSFIPATASSPNDAGRIAALAFLVGYTMAALGPVTLGFFAETVGWTICLAALGLVTMGQIVPAVALARRTEGK